MKTLRAAVFAALFVSVAAMPTRVRADDITLRSHDGAIEVTGTLLDFDGTFYRVDTTFGVLTLDGSRVDCAGAACPRPGPLVSRFVLSGAGMMAEALLPALIEGFAETVGYPLTLGRDADGEAVYHLADAARETEIAEITLRSSTTADGFVDLISDQADMVLALRNVNDFEQALAKDAGLGNLAGPRQYRVLGLDALVAVVNAGNPVPRITLDALAAVFAGDIETWSDLGAERAAITLHLTDPQEGVGALFVEHVVEPAGKALSAALVRHSDLDALTAALERDPHGIGITTLSRAGDLRALTLAGGCRLDVTAGPTTVKTGDYPLTVPLYLYLPGRRLPEVARDFLIYLRSPSAQEVVRTAGFVDRTFAEIPLSTQGARLANAIRAAGPEVSLEDLQRMMPLFIDNRRLTPTFRFHDGTTALDPPSLANLDVLAAALEAGTFDGRRLSFVGFSDGVGSASANLRLSRRRAETVRAAVLARAGALDRTKVLIKTDGYGEALPMACDETVWGRQLNRRVEIWVD
jgi:phosphate transport system substrate-binding protein